MAPQMKGLTQFIMDLRSAQDAEEERKRVNVEISNIRTKFASPLTPYQHRKYVCKLIYIHLLGLTDEVEFGIDKAYELINSKNYLDKQLGYLLVSLLQKRSGISQLSFVQNLIEKTYRQLLNDLRADSDDLNVLALLFIVSNFNFDLLTPGESLIISYEDQTIDLWQDLSRIVYGLCMSPTASKLVKKKASVAMLVVLKLVPSEVEENDNWIPRLLSLIDETDISLILSAVPLASYLTDYKPSYAKAIMPAVAQRLYSLVVDSTCPPENFYYDIPSPWLVVKLLQLAEKYFVKCEHSDSLDSSTIQKLRLVVSSSIQNALVPRKAQTSRNANSAILFQAVSIATYLEASPEALSGAVHALVQLVDSAETNTRYLALDTLIKLVARSNEKLFFSDHLEKIFDTLHNKDISVRKKTIDLLYIVCDELSYTQIVSHLLDYYPAAETSLQTSISIKVALIAERFATDSSWYVSSMLRLLTHSQNSSPAIGATDECEVWERVVQVIVNNEDLTVKASKFIINLLRKSSNNLLADLLIKASAFVLGEFGYKLNALDLDQDQFGIDAQFHILYDTYFIANPQTRPLIMSSFLKFINRFPSADFVPDIMDLFEAETVSLDLEIQKRASESLKVAALLVSGDEKDASFARSLLEPLPPFEKKDNQLLKQLGKITLANRSTSSLNKTLLHAPHAPSLEGAEGNDPSDVSDSNNPFSSENSNKSLPLSSNWYDGYHRMLQYDAGIFYEDLFLKVTYKIHRSGNSYTIAFIIINNAARTTGASISAFTVNALEYDENGSFVATMTKTPDLTILDRTDMEISVKICDIVENKSGPILSITYKCSGSFNSLRLKVPVPLLKCLSSTSMGSIDEFKKRWVQIGTSLGVAEGEHSGTLIAPHRYNCAFLASTLNRLGFAIVQKTPEDPNSGIMITSAGILRTLKTNYGVLLSLRSVDQEAKSFQLTVRSTGGGLPPLIFELVQEIFRFQS